MKNYPHLYTPASKKASFSNQIKTHKKATSTLTGTPQYSKIPSTRTINQRTTQIMNPKRINGNSNGNHNHPRICSRSIEEMPFDRSSDDNNYQDVRDRNQLFSRQTIRHKDQRQNGFYPGQEPKEMSYSINDPLKQMQQQYHHRNSYENQSLHSNQDNNQASQLFQKSYQKLDQIKYQSQNPNIDNQLHQVLELIKEEKFRANETVKTLKKTADHYKKIYETVNKQFTQVGTNTQDQLPLFKQYDSKQAQIQVQIGEHAVAKDKQNRTHSPTFSKCEQQKQSQGSKIPQNSTKNKQNSNQIDGNQKSIYMKLATMLQDMNINSKEILPEEIQIEFEPKNYKVLTQPEVIKIQKFFIKKLVEKIPQ